MKTSRIVAACLAALLLLLGMAGAENSLWPQYATRFSESASQAALACQVPAGLSLTQREKEIYQLGFAAGYDQAAGNDATRTAGERYVLNLNTMKFHLPSCASVQDIKEKNKRMFEGPRSVLIDVGYSPCKNCKP